MTTNGKRIEEGLVRRMTSVLSHRGPDDDGVYLSSKLEVGLGHRRLSIIDLSEAARQPMSNEDKTVWMVFNGEIYNFQSLKADLEKKGHYFSSQTDCEVVIHLYEEEGIKGVKKLAGMFAFAIWDEKSQAFFLCRDRLGIKPLIYYWNRESLIFASEIKGILQDPDVPREIDWNALDLYLTFNFIPAPYTVFKGVKKLRPGHILIFSKGEIEEKEYWNIDGNVQMEAGGKEDFASLKNTLFEVMEDA
ncbi:MAG: asparagine synthetase B, partial [Desulfobacterales bacterium]|nr:asparagine synthetase B [Desulfobacterales bacterium]